MARSKHRKKASYWVKNHLGHRYGVNQASVKDADKLKDWGLSREEHFADVAGAFNQSVHADPDWHGAAISPPELIDGVRDGTVGDLTDLLTDRVATSSLALFHVPDAGEVETFLISQLGPPRQNKITKDSRFNTPALTLNGGEENNVEVAFCAQKGIRILGLLKYCSGDGTPTVRQVAGCMANYIKTRGRIAS